MGLEMELAREVRGGEEDRGAGREVDGLRRGIEGGVTASDGEDFEGVVWGEVARLRVVPAEELKVGAEDELFPVVGEEGG